MRRHVLAVGALVAVLALSGCVGFLTGETVAFESSAAVVPNSSAAEAGFTLQQYNETELNQTVEVFGMEREIRISFHQAVYTSLLPGNVSLNESINREDISNETLQNRSLSNSSLQPTAVTIISVPDAQFFGQSVNPLVRLPNEQLIERFGGSSGGVSNLEKSGSRTITMLGSDTELTEFNGTAEREGQSSESTISIAKTAHEGDVVILVTIEPQGQADDDNLDDFIASLEHPADPPN